MTHSADLYQAFFDTANDAIFVVDVATYTIVAANARAMNASGLQPAEAIGLPIDRLLRPQNGPGLSFFLENCANAKRSCCNGLELLNKDDEALAVDVSATWVVSNSGTYVFLVARESDAMLPCGCPVVESSNTAWSGQEDFPTIIGRSENIHNVCRLIGVVAKSDVTVLIQGESGTGKEIIANAIHVHSRRGKGPFVKVNCAALTETLLESELFGHVKGAFTGAIRDRCGRFQQADGGTLLLDEIGSMSLSGQAKLLRVLQEHEFEPVGSSVTTSVNVRVIASTNVDLAQAAREGKFREDLYYRLNVFSIPLPPLRERKEDILSLARHFLCHYSRALGKEIHDIGAETHAVLMEHDWPGNVRELANAVEHAVIVEKGPVVLPSSLPMNLAQLLPGRDDRGLSDEMGLREKLILLERQILLETLLRANGIKKHAADMLGIDARNLPYLLKKHHLDADANVRFDERTRHRSH